MNPWVAFLIGLLAGWLIEWVIDWWYWRRRGQAANQGVDYKSRVDKLEFDNASLSAEKLRLENLLSMRDSQIAERNSRLASLQTAGASQTAEAAVRTGQVADIEAEGMGVAPAHDDLTRVAGVSPEIAEWLHESGIHTYGELGGLRPSALRAMLGQRSFQTESEAEVVKSARMLAGSLHQVDDLELIDGIGPVIAKILYNEGVFSFGDVADLNAIQLREIVGERIQRLADEEKILAHARQLAGRE